jgi:hypothetical protein
MMFENKIMLGPTLLGLALLVIFVVLYGHTNRENFTNMKGAYPKWIDMLEQIRKIFDAQFEYDAMKFAELADKQAEFSSLSGKDIHSFLAKEESKFLPKNFTLNVNTPVDSHIAMLFATRSFCVQEMKKPSSKTKLLLAYGRFYETEASAQKMKSDILFAVLKYCQEHKIILKLKEKTTFSLL